MSWTENIMNEIEQAEHALRDFRDYGSVEALRAAIVYLAKALALVEV
mgnify:CR=1 FL=1